MTDAVRLPLFPLNTVLFPDGLLPLRVFEARYMDMVTRCLRDGASFGARYAEVLPIPLVARQKLLELDDVVSRLEIVQQFLHQRGLLKTAG